ncbi:MAG TPA: electron transport complex subunit E [Victivallales bacterium]|nr:electron transport complex subunit E [Victivallales bacterium]HPO90901.1 electron transport complex subunit E [Victivallales bacterium]HRR27921.1 electron transport complex subunit E [Victivallales bacterium]HRU00376.1 electron transport complex subunit E [Victivallales bacterium]
MSVIKEFTKGLWKENPVLVIVLGMCPTLAVSSSGVKSLGMGVATTFVLAGSNLVISLIRNIVPAKIRIPCYIVVIATFGTIVDLLMQAYSPPALYDALGIFIPLIVVNCIVMGRAEAFASRNTPFISLIDGLGMGAGFTLALVALGLVREFLCSGTLFEVKMISGWSVDFMLLSQAPGAFIVLGFFLAGMNYINKRKAEKAGKKYIPPPELDCRHCRICK